MNETELRIAIMRVLRPDLQIDGALSLLAFAGLYVSQPEAWPGFVLWMNDLGFLPESERAELALLLASGPDAMELARRLTDRVIADD